MIIAPEHTANKGKSDARRHRDKQREIIKKQLPRIIADESIITQRGGKVIKVPIRNLQNPVFRQGLRPRGEGGEGEEGDSGRNGIGQGPGKPGDIIGKRPGGNGQPGKPGSEAGVDYIETEIDIEELIEMMFEDLGLPNLEDKEVQELMVVEGFRVEDIGKSGPWALLHRRRTAREGMRRFYHFLGHLQRETGRSELECFDALERTEGLLEDALVLLRSPDFQVSAQEVKPFPVFENDDLRFIKVEENLDYESNAVVLAMMDVSGSMTEEKKYYVRSTLFWIVQFLRKLYDKVEIRFIIHHALARLVEEEDFFRTGESGGTQCHTAYDLAADLVDSTYPAVRWNIYPFHFSDGEDFSPEATIASIRKLMQKGVRMLGYGEVHAEDGYDAPRLWPAFVQEFGLRSYNSGDLEVCSSVSADFPFLGVKISAKEHILLAIQEFLKKGRWVTTS